jgi:hypothetical protein
LVVAEVDAAHSGILCLLNSEISGIFGGTTSGGLFLVQCAGSKGENGQEPVGRKSLRTMVSVIMFGREKIVKGGIPGLGGDLMMRCGQKRTTSLGFV